MPAYNEAGNLAAVVPDVLAMLRSLSPAVELIIVDDGSRDRTVQLARELAGFQPELVVLELSLIFG